MNEEITDNDRYQQDMRIAEIRRDDAYRALGVYAYELTKRGSIYDPRISELAGQIDLLIDEIATVMGRGREVPPDKTQSNRKPCSHCGHLILKDAEFCGYCGIRFSGVAAEEDGLEEVAAEEKTKALNEGEEREEIEEPDELEPEPGPEEHEVILIECPHCGEEAEEGSAFCLFCGKSLAEEGNEAPVDGGFVAAEIEEAEEEKGGQPRPALCPHCGDELEEGAVFCVACGKETVALLEPEPGAEDTSAQEQEDTPPSVDTEAEMTVVEARICRFCGVQIDEDTVFCLSCGKKVDEEQGDLTD